MNDLLKVLMIVLVIMYVISPIDAVPGPIDDMILIVLSAMVNKRIEENQ